MTEQRLASTSYTSIPGKQVDRELSTHVAKHGKPTLITRDNGIKFTSNAILLGSLQCAVEWHYITMDVRRIAVSVKSFTGGCATNSKRTLFYDLGHTRSALARRVVDYNDHRQHLALSYLKPRALAATFTATGDHPHQLRRATAYHPAQER